MTGLTIPALPDAGALAGTEPIETVQGGNSVKTTLGAVAALAPSALPSILVESGSSAKISALGAAAALAGTELVAIVQGGVTLQTTPQAIANLATIGGSVNQSASTSYTFALSDAATYLQFTSGSAVTATIPTNASVAFAIGAEIDIEQNGAGVVTFSAAGGVTLRSNSGLVATNGQYAVATLKKVATNTWTLLGNLT